MNRSSMKRIDSGNRFHSIKRSGELVLPLCFLLALLALSLSGCASGRPMVDVPPGQVFRIPVTGNAGEEYLNDRDSPVGTFQPTSGIAELGFFANGTRLLVATYFNYPRAASSTYAGVRHSLFDGAWVEIIDVATGELKDRAFLDFAGYPGPIVHDRDGEYAYLGTEDGFVVRVDAENPDTLMTTTPDRNTPDTILSVAAASRVDAIRRGGAAQPVSPDNQRVIDFTDSIVRIFERTGGITDEVRLLSETLLEANPLNDEVYRPVYGGWVNGGEHFYLVQQPSPLLTDVSEVWYYDAAGETQELLISTHDFWGWGTNGLNEGAALPDVGRVLMELSSANGLDQLRSLALTEDGGLVLESAVEIADGIRLEGFAASAALPNQFVIRGGTMANDAAAQVWSFLPLSPEYEIIGSYAEIPQSIEISEDGRLLALGYDNGTVDLWDLQSREAVWTSDTASNNLDERVPRASGPGVRTENLPSLRRVVTTHR